MAMLSLKDSGISVRHITHSQERRRETFLADNFLGVSVDNLNAAMERLEGLEVNWKKRLTDGRMRDVAFILDPDSYWIEIIQNEKLKPKANV
jgi:hypothetical protein